MNANKLISATKKWYLLIILTSLTTGYAVKIFFLPTSTFKYFLSIAFSIYLLLIPFSKSIKHVEFLLFSLIIFFFESTVDTNVPYYIYISESGIKIITPLIIFFCLNNKPISTILLKTGIFLTFAAHGLLATNIITTPEIFYLITIKILHFDTNKTIIFLFIFGSLDIIAVLLLLDNFTITYKMALYYCIIWGFLTAIARTLYVYDTCLSETLFKGITETLIRLPNSYIPFLLLYINKKE